MLQRLVLLATVKSSQTHCHASTVQTLQRATAQDSLLGDDIYIFAPEDLLMMLDADK